MVSKQDKGLAFQALVTNGKSHEQFGVMGDVDLYGVFSIVEVTEKVKSESVGDEDLDKIIAALEPGVYNFYQRPDEVIYIRGPVDFNSALLDYSMRLGELIKAKTDYENAY